MVLKSAKHNRKKRELDFEGLESRLMLAASIDGNGNLTIDGTAGDDIIFVAAPAPGTVIIQASDAVLAGSTGQAVGPIASPVPGLSLVAYTGVNNVTVNAGDGSDTVVTGALLVPALTPVASVFTGELNINLGNGATNVGIVANSTVGNVGQQQAVRIFGGSGDDTVAFSGSVANEDLNIRTYGGNDVVVAGGLGGPLGGASSVRNDAEIFTGDGDDVIVLSGPAGLLTVGTGEFTPDSLVVNGEAGNDVVLVAGAIGPTAPGGLSSVSIKGGSNGAAPGDIFANPGPSAITAGTVTIDEFEVVV